MQVDHPQPHAWQRHLAGFGAASAALGSTSPTSPKPADQVSTSRSIFNLIKKTRGAQPSTGVSATGGSAGQSGSVGHVGNAAHSVGQYGDLTGRNGGSAVTHDLGPSTSARQQATWQRVPSPHHPPPQKSKQQAQHEPPPPRHHAADVSIDLAALRDRAVRSTASVVGFRQQHMVRFLRDANLLALKGRRACAMGGVWGAYEDVPVVWEGEGEAEAESSRGSTSAGGAAGAGSGEGRGGRDAERHSPRSHGSGEGSARIGGMAQGGCAGGGEGGKLHARFDEGASARERRREEDVSGEIIAAAGAADCDYNSAVRAAGLTCKQQVLQIPVPSLEEILHVPRSIASDHGGKGRGAGRGGRGVGEDDPLRLSNPPSPSATATAAGTEVPLSLFAAVPTTPGGTGGGGGGRGGGGSPPMAEGGGGRGEWWGRDEVYNHQGHVVQGKRGGEAATGAAGAAGVARAAGEIGSGHATRKVHSTSRVFPRQASPGGGGFGGGWRRAGSPWRGRGGGEGGGEGGKGWGGGGGGGGGGGRMVGIGFVVAAVPRWVTPPRRFWKSGGGEWEGGAAAAAAAGNVAENELSQRSWHGSGAPARNRAAAMR
ncbi:unnamed protein product [Closterium sp. Naga37s-1]|nr:unnamed protein product [Closterium sp. Naga37s-1]